MRSIIIFSVVMFTMTFCVHLCLLNKHVNPLSCVLAVIIVHKGGAGTLCSATACVFILNHLRMKGLDDN